MTEHPRADHHRIDHHRADHPRIDRDRRRFLAIYLNDHLAGATAGSRRFARAEESHRGAAAGPVLERVRREVQQDRRALLRLMRAVGVRRRWSLLLAARVAESLGTLKTNGRVVHRSPLTTVVELEALTLAVAGKAAGWAALLELARHDGRWSTAELSGLLARAQEQQAELEELRRAAVVEVLGAGPARRHLAPVAD